MSAKDNLYKNLIQLGRNLRSKMVEYHGSLIPPVEMILDNIERELSERMLSKASMYDLTRTANDIVCSIVETGGEITPEIEQALTELDLKTRDKVDSYKYAIDFLEDRAEYLKQEAKSFIDTANGLMNAQERLKIALKNNMAASGNNQISGNKYIFKLVPLEPKIVIDEKFLEDKFYREEILKKVDRSSIKEAIKQGEAVAGVTIEPVYALRPSVNKG